MLFLQFADHVTLSMSSKGDISFALNEIEIFESLSGLMLWRNKTHRIWAGQRKRVQIKQKA